MLGVKPKAEKFVHFYNALLLFFVSLYLFALGVRIYILTLE